MEKHNLHFTERAWLKIQAAVHYDTHREVGFFGHMTRSPDGDDGTTYHEVDDILIPPQDAGGAHAEFDVEQGDLDWLLEHIIALGHQPSEWRFWGHSHAMMGTSPSFQDHSTLGMLATKAWPLAGYGIGAVFNAKGEVTGWFATRTAFGGSSYAEGDVKGVTYDSMANPYAEEINAIVKANVKELVTVPPPTTASTPAPGTGAGNSGAKALSFTADEMADAYLCYLNETGTPAKWAWAWERWNSIGIMALDPEDIGWCWLYMRNLDPSDKVDTGLRMAFTNDLYGASGYSLGVVEHQLGPQLVTCTACKSSSLKIDMFCRECIEPLPVLNVEVTA